MPVQVGIVNSNLAINWRGADSVSALPNKVVGAYWPLWETVALDSLPAGYNTAYLAFATPIGGSGRPAGAVYWGDSGIDRPSNFTLAAFATQIQTARARGVCCIVSVGGAGITFDITTLAKKNAFVDSIKAMYDQVGGFDGIDWDIEGQSIDQTQFAAASRDLKAFYGADFAICMAPAGSDVSYKQLAQSLESTGDLDCFAIQYYDYPETDQTTRRAGVVSRTSEIVDTYGVNPHHVATGTKHIGTANLVWTIASIVTSWDQMEGLYPTYRGVFTWESILDRTNSGLFATTVSTAVLT